MVCANCGAHPCKRVRMMMNFHNLTKQHKFRSGGGRSIRLLVAGIFASMVGVAQAAPTAPDIPLKEIPIAQDQSTNCTSRGARKDCRQAGQRHQLKKRNQNSLRENREGTGTLTGKFNDSTRFEQRFHNNAQKEGKQATSTPGKNKKCNATIFALNLDRQARAVNQDFVSGNCQ